MSLIPTNDPRKAGPLAGTTVYKGTSEPLFNMVKVREAIGREGQALAKQVPTIMTELQEKTKEAGDVLDEAVRHCGSALEKLKPLKKDVIEELRGMRMTTTSEAAAMLKPLEEIRKFFLGDDHKQEVERLKEFVELCERLQKLKQSGFHDTDADTMLKLA